ncbi:hypothetical protein EDB84DRAFT_1437870 [Lactarius hengduanensis]|nr:hypothetical protein EDB84DRAFT_1437870 [Lactarius hengduanensis]
MAKLNHTWYRGDRWRPEERIMWPWFRVLLNIQIRGTCGITKGITKNVWTKNGAVTLAIGLVPILHVVHIKRHHWSLPMCCSLRLVVDSIVLFDPLWPESMHPSSEILELP